MEWKVLSRPLALMLFSGVAIWTATAVPSPASVATRDVSGVYSVACPSKDVCFAGATLKTRSSMDRAAVFTTRNGGASWSLLATVSIGPQVLVCPTTQDCIGGAFSDRVVVTTDGGRRWTTHLVSSSLAEVQAISCPAAGDCWLSAITSRDDVFVYHSTNLGASWSKEKTPALMVPMGSPSGIACVTRTECIITGIGVLRTTNGGRKWTRYSRPSPGFLGQLTCPSAHDCLAIRDVSSAVPSIASGAVYSTSNMGATWKLRLSPRQVMSLNGLSCLSASRCVSVGYGYTAKGKSYTYWGAVERTSDGGTSWVQERESKLPALIGVSCIRRTSHCLAVGGSDVYSSTNDGKTWTAEPLL